MPTNKPKIAIIHDWLTVRGGAENVLFNLHEIFPEAPIYTTIYNPTNFPELKTAQVIPSYLNIIPGSKTHHQLLIPLMPKAIESFDLTNFDIIISNSTACAKGAIRGTKAKHICYCNTPLRYVWFPEIDPRANSSWIRRAAAKYLKKWDIATIDRVDHYLANSQYIADRIKSCYNRSAEVVYPPVATEKFHRSKQIGDYFLYTGRLVAYKKPDIVVDAFNQLGLKLKIVGSGPEKERLEKIAKPNIEFLGRITDEELIKTYSEAIAYIFPTIDDFGIVPVEAMASGRPVIAISEGGAAETVIDGKTGSHFKNQTSADIIQAVKNFNQNDYNPEEIVEWAQKFDTKVFQAKIKKAVSAAFDSLPK